MRISNSTEALKRSSRASGDSANRPAHALAPAGEADDDVAFMGLRFVVERDCQVRAFRPLNGGYQSGPRANRRRRRWTANRFDTTPPGRYGERTLSAG